jgi:hypothetical protein
MRRKSPRVLAKKHYSTEQRKKHRKDTGQVLLPPKPYKSWLEAGVANALKALKKKFQYEEVKLQYVVPAQVHTYTPDFKLDNDIIVETKGRWKAEDRKKMGLIYEQHPELDIRMLFATDNKISKNSKTRYSDWCEKRGIKYAIGTEVPKEWLDE